MSLSRYLLARFFLFILWVSCLGLDIWFTIKSLHKPNRIARWKVCRADTRYVYARASYTIESERDAYLNLKKDEM